jgi:protease-4
MPYSKLSLSLAVPLMRWVPGLSVGLSYSRLWSRSNAAADDLNQFDLALSYRPHRVVALGLVARAINSPRSGRWLGDQELIAPGMTLPQVALPLRARPRDRAAADPRGADPRAGARGSHRAGQPVRDYRFLTPVVVAARARRGGGASLRAFAEGELYARVAQRRTGAGPGSARDGGPRVRPRPRRPGGRAVAGVRRGGMPVAQGFAGKLRVSAERYPSLAERTGEALRITLGGTPGTAACTA